MVDSRFMLPWWPCVCVCVHKYALVLKHTQVQYMCMYNDNLVPDLLMHTFISVGLWCNYNVHPFGGVCHSSAVVIIHAVHRTMYIHYVQ